MTWASIDFDVECWYLKDDYIISDLLFGYIICKYFADCQK